MNQLPFILRPAVRKGPRYSVRPFYTTLLVFAALVALSWAIRSNIIGQFPRRTPANVFLARRETEPEVQCLPVHPLYDNLFLVGQQRKLNVDVRFRLVPSSS